MSNCLLKSPDGCVKDFLRGLQSTYPGLLVDINSNCVVMRKEKNSNVGLLSGGGSGHEPFSAGYVGENMLAGSVSGHIYTSPPAGAIRKAIEYMDKIYTGGILAIVLNYTGDILNFGLAIEQATNQGIKIESIVVDDDVAHIKDASGSNFVGRRGLSGSVLVFKILGAMAASGTSLSSLISTANAINQKMCSMGFGIKPSTYPGSDEEHWSLEKGYIEIGTGAHGEAGIETIKEPSLPDLVEIMLTRLMSNFAYNKGDNVILLVNNMGTCYDIELYSFASEVKYQLEVNHKVKVARMYVGRFMTSLNQKGAQITLLNVTDKQQWVQSLDKATTAFGWTGSKLTEQGGSKQERNLSSSQPTPLKILGMQLSAPQIKSYRNALIACCEALQHEEAKINDLDKVCGDGDCGRCLKRFSDDLMKRIKEIPLESLGTSMLIISHIAENSMGGTQGALYSLMFLGGSRNSTTWTDFVRGAIELVGKYSKAKVGDRTMMDALLPASQIFISRMQNDKNPIAALEAALTAATGGCESTAKMKARMGRASYVNAEKVHGLDAGAYGVVVWMKALTQSLKQPT